jgi:diacylglycerol kinase family enzyme
VTVIILHNSRSGSGKAQTNADNAAKTLAEANIPITRRTIGTDPPLDAAALANAHALVVVGGDGTVLRAAPPAIAANCPLFHLPTGNENLFARAFDMTADPARLLEAVQKNNTARAAVASLEANETTTDFLLMCSLGPDAGVIARLANLRNRPTGHRAYTRPILAEIFKPTLPRLTIKADNQPLIDSRRGWVIIANARQYALRLDPVQDADITEPRLDLVFMPATTSLGSALALLRARKQPKSFTYAQATSIKITTDSPTPCQIDGESSPPITNLTLTTKPETLPVLLP